MSSSSQPGNTCVSLLSITTYRPRACAAVALQLRTKPRFDAWRTCVRPSIGSANAAAVASVDASSPTRISNV
jgi:hypothetical protein